MGVVTQGIIDMPFEMAMSDELMRRQFYSTVRDEIATLQAEKARLREALKPFAAVASTFSFAIGPDGIDDGLSVIAYVHVRPGLEVVLSTTNFSDARAALGGIND